MGTATAAQQCSKTIVIASIPLQYINNQIAHMVCNDHLEYPIWWFGYTLMLFPHLSAQLLASLPLFATITSYKHHLTKFEHILYSFAHTKACIQLHPDHSSRGDIRCIQWLRRKRKRRKTKPKQFNFHFHLLLFVFFSVESISISTSPTIKKKIYAQGCLWIVNSHTAISKRIENK